MRKLCACGFDIDSDGTWMLCMVNLDKTKIDENRKKEFNQNCSELQQFLEMNDASNKNYFVSNFYAVIENDGLLAKLLNY